MVIHTAADTQRTHNDIDVGVRLVDALRHHAGTAKGVPIAYNDLLRLARLRYPKDLVLDRAVQVGIGAKLRFVEAFCAANGLPNLAALAVGPITMRPPAQYGGDWDADRHAVAAFDWTTIDAQLAEVIFLSLGTTPNKFSVKARRNSRFITSNAPSLVIFTQLLAPDEPARARLPRSALN